MNTGYPQYSPSARKGELGVQAVSQVINGFGWIFRRNPQETDFGIDGQVDIVTDNGSVTGQIFALQIKHGKSFFMEKTKWGYTYRGEEKHFNYLLNYPTLVFIVICHPTDNKIYWALFSPQETQRTGGSWKLTIPFGNVLEFSKKRIIQLLPELTDGLSLLNEYWELNNLILGSDYIAYFVDKSEVDGNEIYKLREFFDRITVTKEIAYHCMGKIEIGFHGYENDLRELYEITEVRAYIEAADSVIKELFFFVRTTEPTHTLALFASCLSDISFPYGRNYKANVIHISFDPKDLGSFLDNHFIGLNMITDWLGMSENEDKKITYSVMRRLFPDLEKEFTDRI